MSVGYFNVHGKVVEMNGGLGDQSTLWFSYETCGEVDTFSQSVVDGADQSVEIRSTIDRIIQFFRSEFGRNSVMISEYLRIRQKF